ncbi:MAG: Gfo/Idh/MocA family oxidoreductase [bacterium]
MNIAVVGSGYWGKNLVRNFFELNSLYAVCELDKSKWAELKEKYGDIKIFATFDEMLADKNVQGVVLATPAPTHFELAKKSIETGLPTFVEKPLTLSLEHSETLTKLAEENKVPLMVGHVLEYHPAIIKMKELFNNDEIGKLKHIRCTRVNLGKIRAQENIWWSFAPHDLSIIFTFLEGQPEKVTASSFKPIQNGIADTVYADLLFNNGASAHIHVSWLEPVKLHQTTLIGEKGMIVFTDSAKENKLMLYKYSFDSNEPSLNKTEEISVDYPEAQPLKAECQHFIDSIANKTNPKTDGKSACKIIAVIEEVDKQLKVF